METKKCSKCKTVKSIREFNKDKNRKDGHTYQCKDCRKRYWVKYFTENSENERKRKRFSYANNLEKERERKIKYRRDNPEKNRENQRKYYVSHSEDIKKKHNNYRKANLESFNERTKKWRITNPERFKELSRKWGKTRWENISYRLNNSISAAMRKSLNGKKNGNHWENLVNYSLQDLRNHLEKQFKEGMAWDNYGKWHIDHIRPIASFYFNSYKEEEFKKCWALTNLQPLWAEENIRKGKKYAETVFC